MSINLNVVKRTVGKKPTKPEPEDEEEETDTEEEEAEEDESSDEDKSTDMLGEEDEDAPAPMKKSMKMPTKPGIAPQQPQAPNPLANYLNYVMYNVPELAISASDIDVIKNKAIPNTFTLVFLDSLSVPRAKIPLNRDVARKVIKTLRQNLEQVEEE